LRHGCASLLATAGLLLLALLPLPAAPPGFDPLGDYEAWIAAYDVPEERRGPEADANGDGIANLIKFMLGADPLAPWQGGQPRIDLVPDADGFVQRILTIERNPAAVGLATIVEVSNDLRQWAAIEFEVVENTATRLRLRVVEHGMERLAAGLVAAWAFDDGLHATHGHSAFAGAAVNGARIDDTRSRFGGGSLRLSRSAAQHVRIPVSPFGTGSYSYAAWYYLDLAAITGSDRYFVLEASNGSSYPASYGLRLTSGLELGQVYSHDDTGTGPNAAFPADAHRRWRHIAVTYDAPSGRFAMYLDGEPTHVTLRLSPGAVSITDSTFLIIGGHRTGSGRNWEGWIDDVGVWSRVLSEREIRLLQTNPLPQVNP
jgi:hypothetical protein